MRNITAYFIIWTGIIFQILDFDMLFQKDFSISEIWKILFIVHADLVVSAQ